MTPYVPLYTKSHFSFLEGASHPEELVEACEQLGLDSLALTDRDGVYGVVEAHVKARELGVRLIIGAEVSVEDGSSIVLLAKDREGYAHLCQLLTRGRRRCEKGESVVRWQEICTHAPGLIALWGGERSLLTGFSEPDFVVTQLREAFGDRLYALAARHRRPQELQEEARLRARAERHGLPVVAGTEVLYHRKARRDLQDVLTCIRNGVSLDAAGRLTKPNAEHAFKTPLGFEKLFEDDPAAVERTREVAARCKFSLDQVRYRYPSEKLPDGTTSSEWLRQLTFEGAAGRYLGMVPPDVRAQLDRELDLIDELDYCGYFLTMWEIVRFCREQDILCQGRGSAANSAVCYCLGITAVDPVRMGLLFERFLSRERAEPPDIDLDIEHNRREEAIQHVFEKYGRSHAAMVANFIRYRSRSAVRDVGKALGLAETALDRLAKLLSPYDAVAPESLARAGLDPELPVHRHLYRLASEIIDVPRHLSIHPGGFLLGHEPVSTLVPIENAAMADRTVIQWDKDSLEELGLFKVDLLGLGALNHLHLAFDLLRDHHGETIGMASIPAGDCETYDMICRADTVGVFQIESRAQMAMLPRLKPRTYYDLVVEVSIVRPGPITGGMVHPYLKRRSGEEPVVYPHECLEPVLKKTLGVPLFQEQVIRLAMVAADYTPGEADQLRRDMAAWRKTGRIERHRERLVQRMMQKGIAREFAESVFEQIRGFGEYGFPESHAASFALIAYAGAWLKRHHPEVFACSLLNALPMGFYSAATIIDDAKRHDVEVRPIDVSYSDWHCTLEKADEKSESESESPGPTDEGGTGTYRGRPTRLRRSSHARRPLTFPRADSSRQQAESESESESDSESESESESVSDSESDSESESETAGPSPHPFAIRVGLRFVKGLRQSVWERIREARDARPFTSAEDLARRARLDEASSTRLAQAGALASLEANRRNALWAVKGLARTEPLALDLSVEERRVDFTGLDLFESVAWDYGSSGLSARSHPLGPLREELTARGLPDARTLNAMPDGSEVRYAGLAICRQRPGTASGVVFMTLEDETGFVNLVIWSKTFDRNAVLIKTAQLLGVSGKLQNQDGVTHLIAERFWVPKLRRKPEAKRSRDFH